MRSPTLKIDTIALSRLLRPKTIEKFVLLLKMLCALLCIFFLLLLTREIIQNRLTLSRALDELSQRAPVTTAPEPTAAPGDLSILVKQPLLGSLDPSKESAKPTPKPASNTALGLAGVFLEDNAPPYAIIEDQKKNVQEVFNIGETVFGEATLKKIFSDRVEIERNGQLEELLLDVPGAGRDSTPSKGGVAALDNNLYVVEEAEVDKALENLPLVLTQARAVPYFKDGVSIGLRLFAIKSDSIFEKIGLKNGDILKSVNGSSLADLTQAIKLFEALKQERSISIRLERNLEEREHKYEIR